MSIAGSGRKLLRSKLLNAKSVGLMVAALLFTSIVASPIHAQERGGNRMSRGGMRGSSDNEFLKPIGLKIGDPLPDAKGYDIDGKELSLQDINGKHSVIVFGCMT